MSKQEDLPTYVPLSANAFASNINVFSGFEKNDLVKTKLLQAY